MKLKKKRFIAWGVTLALMAGLYAAACCPGLKISVYTEKTDKVTAPVRMAVIADLHDSAYGEGQEKLLAAIREQDPDLVLFVGDIFDHRRAHDRARQLLSALGAQYPCYFVTGNHEGQSSVAKVLKETLSAYGVTLLAGGAVTVPIGDQTVRLCGIDDPNVAGRTEYSDLNWQAQLDACEAAAGDGNYTVLLSHRPARAESYKKGGFDLVLAGHSHGGQVRIPGILNGLFASNEGFFPEYAGGRYELGETVMLVSRGLCKNAIPRIFNPPELVIVDLEPVE